MKRRQTSMPGQWLIADERNVEQLWPALRKIRRGSGVLVLLRDIAPQERLKLLRKLRQVGRMKSLTIVDESAGSAKRVHNIRELRSALLAHTPMILLSPLYSTASHPDWVPLPRMRAAALARLAGRRLIALGGMSAKRFSRVERLGFQAWAGLGAFRT
jgi:thiamine-phosphate pyrophosphorylase